MGCSTTLIFFSDLARKHHIIYHSPAVYHFLLPFLHENCILFLVVLWQISWKKRYCEGSSFKFVKLLLDIPETVSSIDYGNF